MRFTWTLLFFTMLVAGCKNTGNDDKKVTIGMVTFPGYAPLYLAKEKEFYQELEVDLVRIEDIAGLRAAMQSGEVDIYAATHDIFQANQGNTPPGVGFIAIDESSGGDGVAVAEGIETLVDLKGKRIGVEPGFPPYFILESKLAEAGLNWNDVEQVDLSSEDAVSAFAGKSIDVVGAYEPFLSKAVEKRPNSRVLLSSKNTPGLIVDLLFASDAIIAEHPEHLTIVAEGWFKAVEYIKKHPAESYGIMGNAFGVSAGEMEEFQSGLKWLTKEDNLSYFNRKNATNAFQTFEMVGNVLSLNNPKQKMLSADDKLTAIIIEHFK